MFKKPKLSPLQHVLTLWHCSIFSFYDFLTFYLQRHPSSFWIKRLDVKQSQWVSFFTFGTMKNSKLSIWREIVFFNFQTPIFFNTVLFLEVDFWKNLVHVKISKVLTLHQDYFAFYWRKSIVSTRALAFVSAGYTWSFELLSEYDRGNIDVLKLFFEFLIQTSWAYFEDIRRAGNRSSSWSCTFISLEKFRNCWLCSFATRRWK